MTPDQLTYDDVADFLVDRIGEVRDLEPLTGGAWSSAWAYRCGDEELVVRFGNERTWYEADRTAMGFAGTDLPVPEVREVGSTPSGGAYAISVRHHGEFLEDTPVERGATVGPTLTRLLVALFRIRADAQAPVMWHQGGPPAASWRDFLLAGLRDDPGKIVHGWGAMLAADPKLGPLGAAATARVTELVDACPERRDLVHGDLLHGNVLVSPDSRQVEAVLSWKCSVRGDFLYDAAWCTFWSPWHPGIAAADPLTRLLQDAAIRADPAALVDAAERHHCYELQIGYSHLGWNIWTDNRQALKETADRLAEVLERGPVRLQM
ncbi:phosphotransferase [Microlunatus elymi]|uniref:Phosphotransferase n=1 Tax=Microlunatus elymi TaxID=2596828 RepID=A0A516Q409_9ACTN|nr:phosphotransferase [Microlunatus elymi]QDP98177.1 phosphotransferase [Microlunatus elymi]